MNGGEQALDTGKWAEAKAERFLADLGYVILSRNYRCTRGEIDLVMRDGETVVFVEVRCRAQGRTAALDSITTRKRLRIVMAARHYLMRTRSTAPCRFDVVCIVGHPDNTSTYIEHLPNAFSLDDA